MSWPTAKIPTELLINAARFKISIALCTYNGAAFLEEQLDSILAQTRLPDELVVCDDGSTDDTVPQLHAFAARSPFAVHLHLNESNLGSTRNFEKAIELCRGEIIALCDQDDLWREDKLACMEQAFAQHPRAGCVFSDAVVTDELGQAQATGLWQGMGLTPRLRQQLREHAFKNLLARSRITGATMAFRATYQPLLLPIDDSGPLIHDAWMATLLAAVSEVLPLEEPLIWYRRHAAQQTHEAGKGDGIRSADFYGAHLRQLEAMRDRLDTAGRVFNSDNLDANLRLLDQKIAHVRARLALPTARAPRLAGVLRELGAGRYHRYSNGWRSAARDLVFWV